MAGLTVREKERLTPIAGTYDVIVAGGGIAGVAAALSASRHGRKTLLIERMYGLGGLACLGLVTIYLPLCDGMGRQVCKGLNDEFLRLSISRGWEDKYPDTWMDDKKDHGGQRFEVGYNANVFSILLEQTLCNAGCHLLYGTAVVDVLKQGNLVSGDRIQDYKRVSIEKTLNYIDDHYLEHLTLAGISRNVNMSPSYLEQLFKTLNGFTMWDYILTKRVSDAEKYLVSTDLRVLDISMKCGFASLTYFNRVFKRITGFTPKDYRTKIRM